MSHNPDFLDTIDEVTATEEFLDSVLEYMYYFSEFLMVVEKRVKRFPELQEYLTEDSRNAILEKHINLTSGLSIFRKLKMHSMNPSARQWAKIQSPSANTISLTRFLELFL